MRPPGQRFAAPFVIALSLDLSCSKALDANRPQFGFAFPVARIVSASFGWDGGKA